MSDRVLIFGGSGMLGHKLCQVIAGRAETFVTVRDREIAVRHPRIFEGAEVVDRVDAQDLESITRAFDKAQPTCVVNSIGVVKQLASARDALVSISVNSLFPHRLAEFCAARGARLITISTDCVFSGQTGNYKESDRPDPEDLYGRSKLLGEVQSGNALTIRTSIIGRQIQGSHALLEWFLSQKGQAVKGYSKAIFTGWPTLILSEIILGIITEHPDLKGILHVASKPISKFALLSLINEKFGLNIEISPSDQVDCDRSLNGELFNKLSGFKTPEWEEMVIRMRDDQASYAVPAQLSMK